MGKQNFEEFLRDKHIRQYTGVKDGYEDDFNSWLEMDIEQIMKFADEYAEIIKMSAEEALRKSTLELLK